MIEAIVQEVRILDCESEDPSSNLGGLPFFCYEKRVVLVTTED